jgi:hypothetical protein
VVEKEGGQMEKQNRTLHIGFFVSLIVVLLFVNPVGAGTKVYYGQVIGIEFMMLQVRDDDGRVSVFWCGYKTSVDSRPPLIGDRVKIEYIKDSIMRNAVTRIAVVRKND